MVKEMEVIDLKTELKKRGQPTSGNKGALLARLVDALELKIPIGGKKKALQEPIKKSGLKAFPDMVYWRVLQSNTETVDEPGNFILKNPRAPTIPEEHAQHVLTKHNFDNHFDRPVCIGKH